MPGHLLVGQLLLTAFVVALVLDVLDQRLRQPVHVVPHWLSAVGTVDQRPSQHDLVAGKAQKVSIGAGGHWSLRVDGKADRAFDL